MSKRLWIAAACLYAAMGVVTFGHAAAHAGQPSCLIREQATGRCDTPDFDPAPLAGLIGAVLWPLYWSWELQS